MHWFNEPPRWDVTRDILTLTTGDKTDFWRETFYGWTTDNGHCYFAAQTGDFTAEVAFAADYSALYDQAGLMLRFSESVWLKAAVEFTHGQCSVGTVLTRGQSDWAIGPRVAVNEPTRLRLTRKASVVCVQFAAEAGAFQTLRLGILSDEPAAQIGPMACSPTRAGLVARFVGFTISPPVDFAAEV